MLADRFGGGPSLYWNMPLEQRERLLNLLRIEGEVAEAYAGLEPGDDVVGFGPDGWDDDASEA